MENGLKTDIDKFITERVRKAAYEFDQSAEGVAATKEIEELLATVKAGLSAELQEELEDVMDKISTRQFDVMMDIYKQGLREYRSISNYINEATDEMEG